MNAEEQEDVEANWDELISMQTPGDGFARSATTLAQGGADLSESANPRVLIVDDEPICVKLLSAQLRKTGCVTEGASGGNEALLKAKASPPDLILMDVRMPGLDGYEVTRRLKADPQTVHIPIVLVTGLQEVQDKLNGLEAGADEFLSKPVDLPELIVRIKNLLKLRRYEEQLRHRASAGGFSLEQGVDAQSPNRPQFARILFLGGENGGRTTLRTHLEGQGFRVDVASYDADRLSADHLGTTDLVILNAELPGVDTFEICRRIKQGKAAVGIPLIVFTDRNDADRRIRYLSLGADDLLQWSVDPRELAARVGRLLNQKWYFDSLQVRYDSAVAASNNDGLTMLFNRSYFQRFLELEMKRSQRQNHPTSLILLDIDDFKSKNDTLGHVAGDRILSEVGLRIRSSIREIDMPARYGGEEFAVVLPYTDRPGAKVVAERIRRALSSEAFLLGDLCEIQVSASIGVATCPENGKGSVELTRAADSMVYQAKKEGKNRVCIMGPEAAPTPS
jgi:two-component system cell cycle response regulator